MRLMAAQELQNNVQLQQLMQERGMYMLNKHPEIRSQMQRDPSALLAPLLASAIQQDRRWVGDWAIKALALAMQTPIIVINDHDLQLYTTSFGTGGRSFEKEAAIKYPRGGTRRVPKKDVPAEVLDPHTCFLVFNGRDHFWAALRSGAHVTKVQLQSAVGEAFIDYAV